MIIDTSALLAILRAEPDALEYAQGLAGASIRRISAVNYMEAAAVIDAGHDPVASRRFDELLREAQCVVEPVTEAQARLAREAYRDFGRETSHPAKLNFGDCFAYALAKAINEPLLFKRKDFKYTDVTPAIPRRRFEP